MADLQTLWRNRSDDQVVEALASLDDYSQEAQAVIRREQIARGLPPPLVLGPMAGDALPDVGPARRLAFGLVALQWTTLLYFLVLQDSLPGPLRATVTDMAAVVFLATVIAVPIAIRRLVRQLGMASSLSWFSAMPLLSLLFVLNYRSIVASAAQRRYVAAPMHASDAGRLRT